MTSAALPPGIAAGPVAERATGRVAAVLALGSAVAHVAAVDAASLASLAIAAMALACLPCAWHLWRAPTRSVWAVTVAVDVGMLAVHAPMAAGAHHHGAASPWPGLVLVTASLLVGLAVLARGRGADRAATREALGP
ncbi:hypothetical protein [Geodermatophilus marinus]|uniref:hypothetical protein n=1 Tax=Geodermatophilus sp. LHW52908 TaxID=2303986 RepID=UPI000E3EB059|nr:hypothetical protein [Geodermatophilus sp. LHW52908]RFU22473.1 hypothetical protein D0Z06_04260 [Geodermatophilus sp. LHW52908]